jgi:DtxR family Mn-dependent transcriptional regulator
MVDDLSAHALADLDEGDCTTIDHVSDEDADLLHLLEQRGLLPGASVQVVETRPLEGLMVVAVDGAEQLIGRAVAERVFVAVPATPA